MTFRAWFEYGDLGCHGRSSLVGRYVCIDGFESFGHDLNHEVISKTLIGIHVVIWEGLLLLKGIRQAILGSLRFFIVTHDVFSSVGTEMFTGGSVGSGWDQIERTGPKDDRQVTA
jgi:hypothetical protein